MIVPLPAALEVVHGAMDPRLIGAEARVSIERATADLPHGMSFFGVECRLAADDPRVDFGTGISAVDGSREIMAQLPLAVAVPGGERWQTLRRLCGAWIESALLSRLMPALYTEFDLPGVATVLGEPSLFGRLDWPRRTNWRDELAAASAAAHEFLRACYDDEIDGARWEAVDGCVRALPPNGWLHGVAVMLGRPARNPRLGLWVPEWRLREYAQRLRLGDVAEWLAAAVRELPDARGPFVELALDVAETVSPRIGIEFTIDNGASPLLDRLVARGLCSDDKAAALRVWPGSDVVRLAGVDWPCTIVRQLSHLKLVLEPGPAIHAKAYLTVTPSFRLFR